MEESIRADAWALKALSEFEQLGYNRQLSFSSFWVCSFLLVPFVSRHGKLVWLAWMSRGYSNQGDVAGWLFGGRSRVVFDPFFVAFLC